MSQLDEIENDVLTFLSKVDGLEYSDRKQLLLLLFKKHMIINQGDVMLSYDDMQSVIDNAKNMYTNILLPVKLQNNKNVLKELAQSEIGNFCIAESVISLLNKKEALKKLPIFKRGK